MEIERKFLVKELPNNIEQYECHHIEQGYLSTGPVVRARKSNDEYYLTYKSGGMMAREEYNLPLSETSYKHLVAKSDGNIISKKRYNIPLNNNLIAELDIFSDKFEGLVIVEVEFNSVKEAETFLPPSWFGDDVTYDKKYHNSFMSKFMGNVEDLYFKK